MKRLGAKVRSSRRSRPERAWSGERLYFNGDDYFRDLLAAMGRARKSVEVETYIFEPGVLADRMVRALVGARRRGLDVKLLVDGVGSPDFLGHYGQELGGAGVPFRVYRSWPTFFSSIFRRFHWVEPLASWRYALRIFNRGKHRDHRKQFILDGREVWIGSFNVSDRHLGKIKKEEAWRDTGLRLTGVRSPVFSLAFRAAWEDPWPHHFLRSFRHFLIDWLVREIQGSPIRMTVTRGLRRDFRKELLGRIEGAKRRIRILTPYFIPTGPLLRALARASRRGCDVRLVLPGMSDVPMVRWASLTYYPFLSRAGCRIFEYQTRVLHAKELQLDDWTLVGSGNLDHRSLRKDLEVNVLLQGKASRKVLERQWERDLAHCREVTARELSDRPLVTRVLSAIFFHFRYWF